MDIFLAIVLLVVGFVLLVYGANFFVDGSSSIAAILKVPSIIIGLTIVALGTSAPEAAVSITASLKGSNAISISNCIGSNFFNLLVVCGVCALFKPLPMSKDLAKRDFPFCLCITGLLLLFCLTGIFGEGSMTIGRVEGIIFVSLYIIYMIVLICSALKNRTEGEAVKTLPVWKSILFIICGAAAIVFGGDLVVDKATIIAKACGMSDTLVGLTIVALGTSLPELVTSIVASRKGEVELALGNCLGSNIANILIVLGLAATISPMQLGNVVIIDSVILLGCTIITFLLCVFDRKLSRREGMLMLGMYIAYTAYIFYRNFAM